jgi:hypothetical protein
MYHNNTTADDCFEITRAKHGGYACSTCIRDTQCGWCATESSCLPGGASVPGNHFIFLFLSLDAALFRGGSRVPWIMGSCIQWATLHPNGTKAGFSECSCDMFNSL